MRELGLAGLVAILAGLGAYYAIGELSVFSVVNLAAGALAVAAAGVQGARRLRQVDYQGLFSAGTPTSQQRCRE